MKTTPSSAPKVRAQLPLTSATAFSQVTPVRAAWNELFCGTHRPLRVQLRKLTLNARTAARR